MRTGFLYDDTICALATGQGMSAIATVRVSGPQAHHIVCGLFHRKGRPFPVEDVEGYRAYYGEIVCSDETLDEAVVTFFKAPHSFTGEDAAEISIHGSVYLQHRLLEVLVEKGARMAMPGEFTRRAFVNRKFDLAQAEAVADLISSESEASHRVAINQLRGGFSKELQTMRSKLLEMTALIELELDFSEEDVEFADRSQLKALLKEVLAKVNKLKDSFRLGNAIKNGIPVAIVGHTNTGKSTLLNAFLGEDRAIVSDIAGTTRDTIEETLNIEGRLYRFIDTAGLRETEETIERIGIERTYRKISEADIVLGMIDGSQSMQAIVEAAKLIVSKVNVLKQKLILVINKSDLMPGSMMFDLNHDFWIRIQDCYEQSINDNGGYMIDQYRYSVTGEELHDIRNLMTFKVLSAKKPEDVEDLKCAINRYHHGWNVSQDTVLVTNVRHYEALVRASESLQAVGQALEDQIPTDLVAQDLRQALYHLGSITGEISTEEVLGTIFSRFCIGK